MILYNRISSRPLKPWNFYTYAPDSKKNFMARFNDEKSFVFLHQLIRYCCERNEGEWPDKITNEIVEHMIEDLGAPIVIEETLIFKEGYVVKERSYYVLTHEFIVGAYLQCPNGNGFPLSTGHIDFTQEEKLAEALRTWMGIEEQQAVKFLVKLAVSMKDQIGLLMHRNLTLKDLLVITRQHNLILELCLEWAVSRGLIADHSPDQISCNGLMVVAYLAMPKL
jgi:hypothetical protein